MINTIQCTDCGLFIKWGDIGKTAGQYRLDPMVRCDETWYPNHYIQMTLVSPLQEKTNETLYQ